MTLRVHIYEFSRTQQRWVWVGIAAEQVSNYNNTILFTQPRKWRRSVPSPNPPKVFIIVDYWKLA